MQRAIGLVPVIAVVMLFASASDADETAGLPRCITMTSEARSKAGGYDHIVHLTNHCGAQASCTVSTNVQPTPTWAELPNQQDTEVVTLRGSTEPAFEPHAFCVVDER